MREPTHSPYLYFKENLNPPPLLKNPKILSKLLLNLLIFAYKFVKNPAPRAEVGCGKTDALRGEKRVLLIKILKE